MFGQRRTGTLARDSVCFWSGKKELYRRGGRAGLAGKR